MKALLKTAWGKAVVIALAAAVLALCVGYVYLFFYNQNPKFRDVTVELGTREIPLSAFLTKYADADKAELVTDLAGLDLSCIGSHDVTLRQGRQEATVKLTVVDTTAPVAVFQDILIPVSQVAEPLDFVVSVDDLSDTTVSFLKAEDESEQGIDHSVSIIVKDSGGNSMIGVCTVRYEWMHREVTLELGKQLTKADVLLNPEADDGLIEQAALDEINAAGLGSYEITSTSWKNTITCTVTVQDTTGPELKLQTVQVRKGQLVLAEDFVSEVSDLSGDVTVRLITQPDVSQYGPQTVTVQAADVHGNVTTAETTLYVAVDFNGPSFSGLTELTVEKHTEIDYMLGVSAKDARDGDVTFTCNSSRVDVTKAGTYYAVYTAQDSCGNTVTKRRKINVNPDEEDTKALVAQIAESLPNDPEAIRDYVRNAIRYSGNWGGDDPTWFGLTKKHGNCYVHAKALQDILTYKGWITRMVWVNGPGNYNKSHYWLIIYIDGGWKHIDATPSRLHGKYSLMNDEQRYETLVRDGVQRDWNRTLTPNCD